MCASMENSPPSSSSLSSFQGDIYQWLPLLNHFDAFFDEIVQPIKSLHLWGDDEIEAAGLDLSSQQKMDQNFPVADCLAVLHVTAVLLDNCSNKQLFASYEVWHVCCQQYWVPHYVTCSVVAVSHHHAVRHAQLCINQAHMLVVQLHLIMQLYSAMAPTRMELIGIRFLISTTKYQNTVHIRLT